MLSATLRNVTVSLLLSAKLVGDFSVNVALNIGCHDIHMDGWVNIDIDPAMRPDVLWDTLN